MFQRLFASCSSPALSMHVVIVICGMWNWYSTFESGFIPSAPDPVVQADARFERIYSDIPVGRVVEFVGPPDSVSPALAQLALPQAILTQGTSADWKVRHEGASATLFSASARSPEGEQGEAPIENSSANPPPSLHQGLMVAAVLTPILVWWLLSTLLIEWLIRESMPGSSRWFVAATTGLPLAVSLASWVQFALREFGLSSGVRYGAETIVAAIGVILLLGRTGRRDRVYRSFGFPQAGQDLSTVNSADAKRPAGVADWIRLSILVLFALAALIRLQDWVHFLPSGDWDAWAIWNLRGRQLTEFRNLHAYSQVPGVVATHLDYPLLLPLTLARFWECVNGYPSVWSASVAIAALLATLGVAVATLAGQCGRAAGVGCATLLLATPGFLYQTARQYADVPLGLMLLCIVACLEIGLGSATSAPGCWLLAGIFCAAAGWTKNEGLLMGAAVAVVVMGISWRRRTWQTAAAFSGGLTAGALPLVWYRYSCPVVNDLVAGQSASTTTARLLDLGRHDIVIRRLATEATKLVGGAWLWVLMGIAVWAMWSRRDTRSLTLFGLLGLILMGEHLTFVATPHNLDWHLGTAQDRLLIQLWPALAFALCRSTVDCSGRRTESTNPARISA